MIEFFLDCVPPKANHQAKKIVRAGGFLKLADKPELEEAKASLDALLIDAKKECGALPITGNVRITMSFTWPWTSSFSARKRAPGLAWKPTSPDVDNLAKTLIDRLAKLNFIGNDAEVCDLKVRKFYGDRPGISVWIAQCGVIE